MINLNLGDCMDAMASMPDNAYDLAIVDPPYGISINMNIGRRKGKAKKHKDKKWDDSAPDSEYFNELFRVSKNQIIWGGNNFQLPSSQYFAIWDKGEQIYGRDFVECEFAWVRAGGTRIMKLAPFQNDRIHPTQKPVKLYKWLLQNYANDGDRILDTHLGSGSIAIACYDMGYDLDAWEIDPEYHEAAVKRFEQHTSQLQLFISP